MNVSEEAPHALEKATMRRVILRLVPFLMVCYFFALLDRVNIGFAALQMNKACRARRPRCIGFAAPASSSSATSWSRCRAISRCSASARAGGSPDHDHLGLVTACMAFA